MLVCFYRLYFWFKNSSLLCIKNNVACVLNKMNGKFDFYYVYSPFEVTYFESADDKTSAIFTWKILLNR